MITAKMFDVASPGASLGPKANIPGGISLMPSSGSPRTLMMMAMRPMRDRIEALGGTLEIVSRAGEGTLVRAVLPVEG